MTIKHFRILLRLWNGKFFFSYSINYNANVTCPRHHNSQNQRAQMFFLSYSLKPKERKKNLIFHPVQTLFFLMHALIFLSIYIFFYTWSCEHWIHFFKMLCEPSSNNVSFSITYNANKLQISKPVLTFSFFFAFSHFVCYRYKFF